MKIENDRGETMFEDKNEILLMDIYSYGVDAEDLLREDQIDESQMEEELEEEQLENDQDFIISQQQGAWLDDYLDAIDELEEENG